MIKKQLWLVNYPGTLVLGLCSQYIKYCSLHLRRTNLRHNISNQHNQRSIQLIHKTLDPRQLLAFFKRATVHTATQKMVKTRGERDSGSCVVPRKAGVLKIILS